MTDVSFKEKYYQPYSETWKILRLIQYADKTSDSDAQWQRYCDEMDRLRKTYPGNEFAEQLVRLLLDAGDIIAKDNQRIREDQR